MVQFVTLLETHRVTVRLELLEILTIGAHRLPHGFANLDSVVLILSAQ